MHGHWHDLVYLLNHCEETPWIRNNSDKTACLKFEWRGLQRLHVHCTSNDVPTKYTFCSEVETLNA